MNQQNNNNGGQSLLPVKVLLEIQGNLYDVWGFRTLERINDVYDEETEDLCYTIVVNRLVSELESYSKIEFKFVTREERDRIYKIVKDALAEHFMVAMIKCE